MCAGSHTAYIHILGAARENQWIWQQCYSVPTRPSFLCSFLWKNFKTTINAIAQVWPFEICWAGWSRENYLPCMSVICQGQWGKCDLARMLPCKPAIQRRVLGMDNAAQCNLLTWFSGHLGTPLYRIIHWKTENSIHYVSGPFFFLFSPTKM